MVDISAISHCSSPFVRPNSIIPILAIMRQRLGHLEQFPSRIAHRDRSPKFIWIGFEKLVRDDQRLDGLPNNTAAGRDCLISGESGKI